MTRQFTLPEVLCAMADECQSGQRTGKSDRWALTLRAAARTLEQAEAARQQAEAREKHWCDLAHTRTRERDRLAAALRKVRAHTSYLPSAERDLLTGLLARIERITVAALWAEVQIADAQRQREVEGA